MVSSNVVYEWVFPAEGPWKRVLRFDSAVQIIRISSFGRMLDLFVIRR